MDRAVDHECCGVEKTVLAAIDDLSAVVDQDEIALRHERKGTTEWVDPETVWVHRVAECDVTSYTLVESIFAKDAEGCCKTSLEEFSLFVLVFW
jgi:hypothetical protein